MAASGHMIEQIAHPVQPSLYRYAGWNPFGVRCSMFNLRTSWGQTEMHNSQPLQYISLTSIQPIAGINDQLIYNENPTMKYSIIKELIIYASNRLDRS